MENALLLDICLGFPLGKIWIPAELPKPPADEIPPTFLLKGDQLASLKRLYINQDQAVLRAVKSLSSHADKYLKIKNPTVVDKVEMPSLVDTTQDYISLAKYWWPSPDKENGIPYINHDGEINPECYSDKYDLTRLELFSEAVLLLSFSAFLSGNKNHAEKAASMIETWFTDLNTRQTPHFKYSQIVIGKDEPRFQGLIESRRLIYCCEAMQLLKHIDAIEPYVYGQCQSWFNDLLNWFIESDQGKKASEAKNNIGFWYDLQTIVYSLFIGKKEQAELIIKKSVLPRTSLQVDEEGKLINELSRAKPYDYVAFTLLAMAELYLAGSAGEINLPELNDEEGRSYEAPFNWFNDTINSNNLQHAGVALMQQLSLQRQISKLKRDNSLFKHAKNGLDGLPEEEWLSIDKENLILQDESNYYSRNLLNIALHYHASNYIMQKQSYEIEHIEKKLEQRRINIEKREKQADQKDFQIKNLQEITHSKEVELQNLKQECSEYKNECTAIKNSTSWKLTYPLRFVVSRIKGKSGNSIQIKRDTPSSNNESRQIKDPVALMRSVKPQNIDALKKEYKEKGLDKVPDTFALYRIIGNDLYPRHKKGQSYENLKYILENEADFKNCEKVFVINRIINKDEEKRIINLLKEHNQTYICLPFVVDEYKKINIDINCLPEPGFLASKTFSSLGPEQKSRAIVATYRLKNNYVMNNNGARNFALKDGKSRAKWVLPWDGNCFITKIAWDEIHNEIVNSPFLKYFAVPMARVTENSLLLSDEFIPEPVEEPQLLFRNDTQETFNEDFCYGRRPKVELFWRLGIPGKWDNWQDDPWDSKRRSLAPESRQFGVAGWVARLYSGVEVLERGDTDSFKQRGRVRAEAIIQTLQSLDTNLSEMTTQDCISFCEKTLHMEKEAYPTGKDSKLKNIIEQLINKADEALTRRIPSVVDKTTLPPSGNINDYWHPAPYWWPNPYKKVGLPYIKRDGERVTGTIMYESESEKYDRTRLQRVFDDSTILALAWVFTGNMMYAEHGAKILERFFVDPTTRMNPHLNYAQVRMGHNNDLGFSSGIIEMKDLYYYLDSVRILISSGMVAEHSIIKFKEWLSDYLKWLLTSDQGKKESKKTNNHGNYYDLQVASIAGFLDNNNLLYETLIRAQSRIFQQFAPDGSQPEELKRTSTAHYCCFNLQGWLNLGTLASRWGVNLWLYETPNGASLKKGAEWLLLHTGQKWPYQQIEEFDSDRFYPIYFMLKDLGYEIPVKANMPVSKYAVKPLFYPHDGIKPFWNLGCRVR